MTMTRYGVFAGARKLKVLRTRREALRWAATYEAEGRLHIRVNAGNSGEWIRRKGL